MRGTPGRCPRRRASCRRRAASSSCSDVEFVSPGASASTPDEVEALVSTYTDAFPNYFDQLDLLGELGLVPAMAPA